MTTKISYLDLVQDSTGYILTLEIRKKVFEFQFSDLEALKSDMLKVWGNKLVESILSQVERKIKAL